MHRSMCDVKHVVCKLKSKEGYSFCLLPSAASRGCSLTLRTFSDSRDDAGAVATRRSGVAGIHAQHVQHVAEVKAHTAYRHLSVLENGLNRIAKLPPSVQVSISM